MSTGLDLATIIESARAVKEGADWGDVSPMLHAFSGTDERDALICFAGIDESALLDIGIRVACETIPCAGGAALVTDTMAKVMDPDTGEEYGTMEVMVVCLVRPDGSYDITGLPYDSATRVWLGPIPDDTGITGPLVATLVEAVTHGERTAL